MSGHWEPVVEWIEDDDDEREDLDEDDLKEIEYEENLEKGSCICGAWIWSDKSKRFVHVADCCCGRT
jgi:hypothetical protein